MLFILPHKHGPLSAHRSPYIVRKIIFNLNQLPVSISVQLCLLTTSLRSDISHMPPILKAASHIWTYIIGGRQTEGNTNKSQCSSFLPSFSDCLPSGQSRPKNMDDYKHFRARICATAKNHPAVAKPLASRYRADAHQTDSAALHAYIRPAKRRIFIGGITNAHVLTR